MAEGRGWIPEFQSCLGTTERDPALKNRTEHLILRARHVPPTVFPFFGQYQFHHASGSGQAVFLHSSPWFPKVHYAGS